MFDTIGTDRDSEAGKRQVQSLGITSALAGLAAFAIGWTGSALVAAAPVPEPEPPMVCLTCDPVDEPLELPPAPPAPGPSGGGAVDPDPEPVARVLGIADPPKTVVDDRPSGTGVGDPTEPGGPGTGGKGTGTEPCPPGVDCTVTGNPGPRRISHTLLDIEHRVDPTYPSAARRMGMDDARCIADLSIDRAGKVYAVAVSGCPAVFHLATEEALLKWRYRPVQTEVGGAVEARTRIAVKYTR